MLLSEIPVPFLEYRLEPRQTRAAFAERGWRKIVAFQTRNPTHRAHEYIQKAALGSATALLLHPLVGETKGDDVPAAVRMETYKVLLEQYYPRDRAMLSVMPAHMRYGGPREAILHAIIRRNYGCTHFIVGRDHAGVGNYYGTYDAQKIFERFSAAEIGIRAADFREHFLLQAMRRDGVVQDLPARDADRLLLSGTKVREMLRQGEAPPPSIRVLRSRLSWRARCARAPEQKLLSGRELARPSCRRSRTVRRAPRPGLHYRRTVVEWTCRRRCHRRAAAAR